jgi:hypothetical protein
MAKNTIGYQAENQFYQSSRSHQGCRIGSYVFSNPRDYTKRATKEEGFDFLCDVLHPTSGLLRDVRVEVKASGKGTVLLTSTETSLALHSNYDSDYLVVVYRHTRASVAKNQFKPKVISTTAFAAASTRLRIKA